jgi:hypothetical protein
MKAASGRGPAGKSLRCGFIREWRQDHLHGNQLGMAKVHVAGDERSAAQPQQLTVLQLRAGICGFLPLQGRQIEFPDNPDRSLARIIWPRG